MRHEREGLTRSKCPQVVPEPWATTLRSQPLCMASLHSSHRARHSGALSWMLLSASQHADIYNLYKCQSYIYNLN